MLTSGLGNVVGLILEYTALRLGKVGLVTPVTSTEGAIAAVLAVIAGEALGVPSAVLLAVVVIGVVLAGVAPDESASDQRKLAAVGWCTGHSGSGTESIAPNHETAGILSQGLPTGRRHGGASNASLLNRLRRRAPLNGRDTLRCPLAREVLPMSESANRATLETLVAALNASDLEGLDRVFTDDVVMEWPQSGERIVGGQNRREIYSRFPSLPHVTPRRTTGSGDLWVLEASLDYGDGEPFQCVFVFEMRDGLIAKETGYWSKPFPAPDWRAPWVERL